MPKSIVSNEYKCLICGKPFGLHKHHVFYGTANRKMSEKYGCWVWLCPYHHNTSMNSIHANPGMDQKLKRETQMIFEQTHSREEFMQIFGRSWID